jgi:hypothetical protein
MFLNDSDADLMHILATKSPSYEAWRAVTELHARCYSDDDIQEERDRILMLRGLRHGRAHLDIHGAVVEHEEREEEA